MKEKEIELLPCLFCGKDSGQARHPGWNSYHCSDSKCAGHDLYAEQLQWNTATAREARLVEALERLARLGNGEHYGNSDGNVIDQNALAEHRGEL